MSKAANKRKTAYSASLIGLFIVGCATSATSFGASPVVCDKAPGQANAMEMNVDDLTIDAVDHYSPDTSSASSESLESSDAATATLSPLMTLSPRVASLLDQIFSSEADSGVPVEESKTAPVADSYSGHPGISSDHESKVSADVAADDGVDVNRIRERMFRKDI